MATTVGGFSAIDDTEVDAESPITETLITRLRDNSYWIDAGTKQTTITDTSKVLKPDGSGGVVWGAGGGSGEKGTLTTIALDTTWTTLTTLTQGILVMHIYAPNSTLTAFYDSHLTIDLSDETFQTMSTTEAIVGSAILTTGTITTGQAVSKMYNNTTLIDFNFRRDSGNLQYQASTGSAGRMNFTWVVL